MLQLDGLIDAAHFANQIHQRGYPSFTKPGTEVPFFYHPLAVASLVLKYGGSVEQAQAAVLHDTLGSPEAARDALTAKFGSRVAELVFAFEDPPQSAGLGWSEARKHYLTKLSLLQADALLIVACEELHELSELLHDLKYRGAQAWKRYPAHSMEVFWYFRELLGIFHKSLRSPQVLPLATEFGGYLRALKEIVFEGAAF